MSNWMDLTGDKSLVAPMAPTPQGRTLRYPGRIAAMVPRQQPQQIQLPAMPADPQQLRMERIRQFREMFRDGQGSDHHYRPSTQNFIDATPPRYLR